MSDKRASTVRAEAARMARDWADERASCGDPEGSDCFRMLAREIEGIKIRPRSLRRVMTETPAYAPRDDDWSDSARYRK